MPNPLTTRRAFLRNGLTLVAASATVPAFLDRTVWALADPTDHPLTQRPTGKDGKVLVVLQLSGGNDGLNTVVPYADDAYHRARPSLGVDAKSVLKLGDDHVGLHPNLAPLMKLWDAGRMAVVQGVGYPNPNRSHFRSMDIWQSARPDEEHAATGWLGRYFDNTCVGLDPHAGVSIGRTLPLAMQGARITPLAFERPENFQYAGQDKEGYKEMNKGEPAEQGGPHTEHMEEVAHPATRQTIHPAQPPAVITPVSQLEFLTRTAMDAQLSSDEVLRIVRGHRTTAAYPPGEFGLGLREVAAMIAGGLPTRVYYVSLGGFDTHANERGRHDNLMQQLAAGVSAFFADLKGQGNDDRVLTMTFSEFGRRVQQNASGGTDHGAAAPVFLFGPTVKPGLVNGHPSLTDLDQGDLKFGTDFRSVYATVLQNWLETPGKPVLGQQFPLLPILKA